MTRLTEAEVAEVLRECPDWRLIEGKLVLDRSFVDFVAAMAFVNKVAGLAEEAGHHPDIDIRYNKVRLALWTHDADGLTRMMPRWRRS